MNNVLLDELPTSWNGYEINTWFQIGIQLGLIQSDDELEDNDKVSLIIELLFSNEDGSMREFPSDPDEMKECIEWFSNGWYTDNKVNTDIKTRVMDFDVDQWRIFADFQSIYHINLNESDMHWWMFCGLLWNMPHDLSSFMQVIEIRQKRPRSKASADEKKAIEQGHKVYDLKPLKKKYTKEEIAAIDAYDAMMAEHKKQKSLEMALTEFNK